jgi:hypothetical protein
MVADEYRSLASRRHAALSDSQNEEFASISHDVAASAQASTAQTRDLKQAYVEGWYVERDPSFHTTLLKTRQPPDMYYAFAVTRPVYLDLIQHH